MDSTQKAFLFTLAIIVLAFVGGVFCAQAIEFIRTCAG